MSPEEAKQRPENLEEQPQRDDAAHEERVGHVKPGGEHGSVQQFTGIILNVGEAAFSSSTKPTPTGRQS